MVLCRHCGTANEAGRTTCIKCERQLIAEHMRGKIPCANHANREATTSCNSCSMRLCDACAYDLSGIEFCEGCAPEGAVEREHHADYEAIPVVDGVKTEHASFFLRAGAFALDGILVIAFVGIMVVVFAMFNGGSTTSKGYQYIWDPNKLAGRVLFGILIGVVVAYHTFLIGMDGRTIGKRITGVIILQEDGRIVDTRAALIRATGQLLSFLPLGLGYLWALWDPKHETWHDKLSKTVAFRYQDTT